MWQQTPTILTGGCEIPLGAIIRPVFISSSSNVPMVYAVESTLSFLQLTLQDACVQLPWLMRCTVLGDGDSYQIGTITEEGSKIGPGRFMPLLTTTEPTSVFDERVRRAATHEQTDAIEIAATQALAKDFRDAHAIRFLRARQLGANYYSVVISIDDIYANQILPRMQSLVSGLENSPDGVGVAEWRKAWKTQGRLMSKPEETVHAITYGDAVLRRRASPDLLEQALLREVGEAYIERWATMSAYLKKSREGTTIVPETRLQHLPLLCTGNDKAYERKLVEFQRVAKSHNTTPKGLLKYIAPGIAGMAISAAAGLVGYAAYKYRQADAELVVDLVSLDVVDVLATLAHTRQVLDKDREKNKELLERIRTGIQKLQAVTKATRTARKNGEDASRGL